VPEVSHEGLGSAKKDHYKDPMDGGKLVPVLNAPAKGTMDKSMPGMKM